MNSENLFRIINIDLYSVTPKYVQVINSVIKAIEDGRISSGYVMPSIKDLCYELDIS